MDVRVIPKPLTKLMSTRLLQQTSFWSGLKSRLGWEALAFDIESDKAPAGDVLILVRQVGVGSTIAYSPLALKNSLTATGEASTSPLSPPELKTFWASCLFIR